MVVTSSGLKCDVCGGYILPLPGVRYNSFRIRGIDRELHVCARETGEQPQCQRKLEAAMKSKRWEDLPSGPLRKAFEDAKKEANHD